MWNWSTDPNAGGSGSTDYTPQNKPAEQIMTQWFTSSPTPPPPSSAPMFSGTSSANPSSPDAGSPTTITVTVKDTSGTLTNGIVDIEVYNSSNQRMAQKFISGQSFASGASQSYSTPWTPSTTGAYRVTIGVFNSNWTRNYYWNNDVLDITVGSGSSPPPPSGGNGITEVWWPVDGSHVSGVQPLKAMVQNADIAQYTMTWAVDGGSPVTMYNSPEGYPHKEALIDFKNWNWKGAGPYTITLTSTDQSGHAISQKSIHIYTP